MGLTKVVLGWGPAPSLVLALISELPDTSRTPASFRGGKEYRGWGMDRYLLAEVLDAINLNSRVSGQNWPDGKIPTIPPWPRPGAEQTAKPRKKRTVKDLWRAMQAGANS